MRTIVLRADDGATGSLDWSAVVPILAAGLGRLWEDDAQKESRESVDCAADWRVTTQDRIGQDANQDD